MNQRYAMLFIDDFQVLQQLSKNALLVYIALVIHSPERTLQRVEGEVHQIRRCYPSQQTLSDITGISASSVQRGIRQLKQLNILTVHQRMGTSAIYILKSPVQASHMLSNQASQHVSNQASQHVSNQASQHVEQQTKREQKKNKTINKEGNVLDFSLLLRGG